MTDTSNSIPEQCPITEHLDSHWTQAWQHTSSALLLANPAAPNCATAAAHTVGSGNEATA